jgi:hypothetical protein
MKKPTKIAWELEALRNARPTNETETAALVARIDAAGHAAAALPNIKTSLKLCREASELYARYCGRGDSRNAPTDQQMKELVAEMQAETGV